MKNRNVKTYITLFIALSFALSVQATSKQKPPVGESIESISWVQQLINLVNE